MDEPLPLRPPGAPARLLFFGLVAAGTLLAWYGLTRWGGLPGFLLPSPAAVGDRFLVALRDGSLVRHTGVTLSEVLAGLGLGVVAGASLGYGLAKSPRAERLL